MAPPNRPPSLRTFARNAALAVAMLFAPDADATNGLEPIGVSTKSQMRGGADVGVGDSALSQISNPASLAFHDQPTLDFAGQLLMPKVEWDALADSSTSHGHYGLMNMALATPVDDRLTLGIALHSKAGMGSTFTMRHLFTVGRRHVTSNINNASVSLNAGYKLTDKLAVGAGARFEVATARFNAVLGPADVSFERGRALGGGFNAGVMYRPREDLSFGAAYRSPSWFSDLAGGDLRASLFGVAPLNLGAGALDSFRLPQQAAVGAGWDITQWCKLVGEARWTDYSNCSFHGCRVTARDLNSIHVPLPLKYHDQWTLIAGAEFKLAPRWTLGLGYNYCTDIVPDDHLFPICAATIQHHFTAGLRYEGDGWWVGGGYILGLADEKTGPGYSKIPLGVDYGLSRIRHVQHSLIFGVGFTW